MANAREGRLNECDPYFSTIESQTIYGGGGIQVVEAGAVDANKIQQLWCIWQHIFKFLKRNPLSYFRVPFLISLLAKILTKKRCAVPMKMGVHLYNCTRQGGVHKAY